MTEHQKYKYSVTIYSNDLAIINCLRSLAQYSQKTGNNRIPWGGTKDSDWKRSQKEVTFRFTEEKYRIVFLDETKRLLPNDLFKIVSQDNNNPAKPQK